MWFSKNNNKQKPFVYCHICQRALDGFTTVCPYCGHPIMNDNGGFFSKKKSNNTKPDKKKNGWW